MRFYGKRAFDWACYGGQYPADRCESSIDLLRWGVIHRSMLPPRQTDLETPNSPTSLHSAKTRFCTFRSKIVGEIQTGYGRGYATLSLIQQPILKTMCAISTWITWICYFQPQLLQPHYRTLSPGTSALLPVITIT